MHPDLPDHQSGIYPRFPKIYDTWVFVAIKAIKNILELGGHPDHHDLPDGCQDDWSHHH